MNSTTKGYVAYISAYFFFLFWVYTELRLHLLIVSVSKPVELKFLAQSPAPGI